MRTTTISDLVRLLRPWRGRILIRHATRQLKIEVRTRNFARSAAVPIDKVTFGRTDVVLTEAAKLVREISQLELARRQGARSSPARERSPDVDRTGS